MSTPKLHELLAVDSNVTNQANKTRLELSKTFADKRHLFERKIVTFQALDEGSKPVVEEQKNIETNVAAELKWITEHLARAIDVGHQIDIGNTSAKANVLLEDGTVILSDVPATSLLQLEKRIAEIHSLVNAVPTLDPAKGFKPDPNEAPGTYRANQVQKNRTKKIPRSFELSPATKEHKAQVQLLQEDVVTGTITEQEWSAMTTPAIKADMLNNCEVLLRAVKRARAKANEQTVTVDANKIGKKLLDFVFAPVFAVAKS